MNTFTTSLLSTTEQNSSNISLATLQEGYITLIKDQSLILANGEDAATFLHNQLSNDIEKLAKDKMIYAAFCTPKGRMQASLQVWKNADCIVLQCASSLQPAFQKRLQMFIMRSKAKLEDVTESHYLFGIGGKNADSFLQNLFTTLPSKPFDKVDSANGSLIKMHDAFEHARYQWMIGKEQFAQLQLSTPNLTIVDASVWQLADILAGIPQVVEKTKEAFVPQMINFELIGGVNFKKGCYPGQEIVARSQYLGKFKRRMAIASVDTIDTTEIEVGMEVYSDNDSTQPCGMIVNASSYFGTGSVCLVEMKLADQEQGKVHLGKPEGALLNFLPLPYAYLDITE